MKRSGPAQSPVRTPVSILTPYRLPPIVNTTVLPLWALRKMFTKWLGKPNFSSMLNNADLEILSNAPTMSRKATHDSSFCLRLCLSALCTAQSASRTPTPGRKPVYSCGSCSHDHALILARITDDTMDAKPSCIPIVLHPESCSRFLPGLYTAIPLADVHCLLTLPCLSSCPAVHLDVFLPSHDLQGLAPAIGLSCCSTFSPLVSSASTSGGSCSPGYDPVVHSAAIASVINAFALSRLSKHACGAIAKKNHTGCAARM